MKLVEVSQNILNARKLNFEFGALNDAFRVALTFFFWRRCKAVMSAQDGKQLCSTRWIAAFRWVFASFFFNNLPIEPNKGGQHVWRRSWQTLPIYKSYEIMCFVKFEVSSSKFHRPNPRQLTGRSWLIWWRTYNKVIIYFKVTISYENTIKI